MGGRRKADYRKGRIRNDQCPWALLIIGTLPPETAIILLHNEATGQKSLARIVNFAGKASQGRERMTVELSSPSYKFWGIYFPPSDSPNEE